MAEKEQEIRDHSRSHGGKQCPPEGAHFSLGSCSTSAQGKATPPLRWTGHWQGICTVLLRSQLSHSSALGNQVLRGTGSQEMRLFPCPPMAVLGRAAWEQDGFRGGYRKQPSAAATGRGRASAWDGCKGSPTQKGKLFDCQGEARMRRSRSGASCCGAGGQAVWDLNWVLWGRRWWRLPGEVWGLLWGRPVAAKGIPRLLQGIGAFLWQLCDGLRAL